MSPIFSLCILLTVFALLFSFIPKFTYNQVRRLLVYHKYPSHPIRSRIVKVIRVYTVLGLTLGLAFFFLVNSSFNPKIDDMSIGKIIPVDPIRLAGLCFLVSFTFVIILRITTLLNKTKIYCWFTSKDEKNAKLRDSYMYDYPGLRAQVSSFLFSIFLTALLGLMTYLVYRVLFVKESLQELNLRVTFESSLTYVTILLAFGLALFLVTIIGEWLLHIVGVHPKCQENYPYNK